jgi:hypothetical protein
MTRHERRQEPIAAEHISVLNVLLLLLLLLLLLQASSSSERGIMTVRAETSLGPGYQQQARSSPWGLPRHVRQSWTG